MQLNYKATTKEGKIYTGIIEAKDPKEAAAHLREKGLMPINLSPKRDTFITQFIPFYNKAGEGEVAFFTRQLSSMLSSGLTLMQSLTVLREQLENKTMKAIVNDIIADIEGGSSLSEALAKHPEQFSPVYLSLIKAAETSGLLDKVVTRLADNIEKRLQLKASIKSALLYPVIVIIGMIIVTAIMMVFVIPQLATLYESLNIDLPLPTRIVVFISNNFIILWPFVLGLFFLFIFSFRRWYHTELGRLSFDKFILNLPIFGKLIAFIILTEVTRTLGLMIGSGGSIVEAVRQTSDIAGNQLYKNALLDISRKVEKGISIGVAFESYALFPAMIVQMAKIGEQTGKLDDSLMRASEYFQREADQRIKNLTVALEPLIMLVLGIGVAFLIIAIITPIYTLTSAIK